MRPRRNRLLRGALVALTAFAAGACTQAQPGRSPQAHTVTGGAEPPEQSTAVIPTLVEDAPDRPPSAAESWRGTAHPESVTRGLSWLASTQGEDGGWGQDGGHGGDARAEVALEHSGNDVANTAIAALAMLRGGSTPTSGHHADNVRRAVDFIVRSVEAAPQEGLSVTDRANTQIQRKLGLYVDTFLANMVLAQVKDRMADDAGNRRVLAALDKCLDKIERNQQHDGSWNADGWAPVISTSLASRGLRMAQEAGMEVDLEVAEKVQGYTAANVAAAPPAADPAEGEDAAVGEFLRGSGRPAVGALGGSAGVDLYAVAQAVEELSRDEDSRERHKEVLDLAMSRMDDQAFVSGFGSMGGEEFISYMNLSDSLVRTGGERWTKWNDGITDRLVKLQNQDGTWAGHHCITGRVACTSAAVLTLLTERTVARGE